MWHKGKNRCGTKGRTGVAQREEQVWHKGKDRCGTKGRTGVAEGEVWETAILLIRK